MGETQKYCPGREVDRNNNNNKKNWEKTEIILGSVRCGSAPNDKTRNAGFHVADVLPKLIGWFLAIPSVMTNEVASYKSGG